MDQVKNPVGNMILANKLPIIPARIDQNESPSQKMLILAEESAVFDARLGHLDILGDRFL